MIDSPPMRTVEESPPEQIAEPPARRQHIGRRGEELAARYLRDAGWEILERNWRHSVPPRGELDLIGCCRAQDGDTLVVAVEVKTRSSLLAGYPAEHVRWDKRLRMARLLRAWLMEADLHVSHIRLDVISVLLCDPLPAQIRHHRGIEVTR